MASEKFPEYNVEQLDKIEDEEYRDSVRRLLPNPDFHRFLVRWVVEVGDVPSHPVAGEDLPQHNWSLSRAALMKEFMAGVQSVHPGEAANIREEVIEYEQRRARALGADDRNAGGYESGDE